MFDFLKKSRAVKFLCSACLICSLGSFVSVYGEDSTPGDQITELYVQGRLGYTSDRIFLAHPSLNRNGILNGTLMYASGLDESGAPNESSAASLWNDLEDSKITLFLKNANNQYIAASGEVKFDANSTGNRYVVNTQLYKLPDDSTPAPIGDTENSEKLTSPIPGKYAVTGVVSYKGNSTLFEGPTLN